MNSDARNWFGLNLRITLPPARNPGAHGYALAFVVAACLALTAGPALADPLGTAITYQGQLKQTGSPAAGSYSMIFKLFDAATLGNQVGPTLTFDGASGNPAPVSVTNGLFTASLDFGAAPYDGNKRWLDVTVNGTPLAPRQELTPAPHARWAKASDSSTTAASVPWSGITGVPANVTGAFSPWTAQTDGTLASWGNNDYGQTNIPTGTFIAISAGPEHSLGIRSDGTLAGWGYNYYGQANVPLGTYIAVAAGFAHSLAILSDGTLVGWGSNSAGQVPPQTALVYTAVAAGDYHSLAIRSNGTLSGWGSNTYGQASVPSGTFISVTANGDHSLGIRSDGTLAGWGRNIYGELNIPSGTFIAVSTGAYHSLAIRSDGTLVGWGRNVEGQINVPSGTFIAVATGGFYSLAIRSDGTLVAWGDNTYGQTIVPSGQFTAVAAGYAHNLAIRPEIATPSAVKALSVSGNADFGGNVGIGTSTPAQRLSVVGTVESTSGGFKFPDGSLQTTAAANGSWSTAGANIYNNNAGNVGIGTTTPGFPLSFNNSLGDKIALWGQAGDHYGLGIQGSLLQIHSDTSNSSISFGYGSSSAFTERMRITGSGNVGIGTTAPGSKLSVIGDIEVTGARLHVDSSGSLGIGTTTPGKRLQIGNLNTPGSEGMIRLESRSGTGGAARNWDIGVPQTGEDLSGAGYSFVIDDPFTGAGPEVMVQVGTGNVGIGTTTPGFPLSFNNSLGDKIALWGQAGNHFGLGIQGGLLQIHSDSSNSVIAFGYGSSSAFTELVRITGSGSVGIGTTVPSAKLTVIGSICASGLIGACSDERFKENVLGLTDALSAITRLRGVSFDWKRDQFCDHQFAEGPQVGFIAQEVEKVLPQVVSTGSDGYKSVDYGRLTPVIVEAMKEQQKQIANAKQENAELRSKLEALERALEKLTPSQKGASR